MPILDPCLTTHKFHRSHTPTSCPISHQVPEKLGAHLFHIAHFNPKGHIQRDGISCRKDHRRSPVAHFSPGFDNEGSPIARSGYMQTCAKHSDCYVCGRHPLTNQHYKCQKRYVLYDTVLTSDNGDMVFVNTTGGSADAFDPDLEEAHITGRNGICIDIDASYNEGCSNQIGAMVKDGLIGCFDGPASKFVCGLSVDVKHGDLSTVSTSGNLFWPRVLLTGSEDHDGDGEADPSMSCSDPIDCTQKCRMLERTARHGAGAPPTCALYAHSIPSNQYSLILMLLNLTTEPCSIFTVATNTAAPTSSPRSWTYATQCGRISGRSSASSPCALETYVPLTLNPK